MNRSATLICVAALLMCSCGAAPTNRASRGEPSPAFNSEYAPASDCWARLYEHRSFTGRALTIEGPAKVADLPPRWGFPWDPRYESLVVGPAAVLALFDDPDLKHQEATFQSGTTVVDLDDQLGRFRHVRSVRVACVDAKHVATRRR